MIISFTSGKSSRKNIRFRGNSQDKSHKCNNIGDLVLHAQKVFAYFLTYIIICLSNDMTTDIYSLSYFGLLVKRHYQQFTKKIAMNIHPINIS